MSGESLAFLRQHRSNDLRHLAEEHFKHDLTDHDRTLLHSAASKFTTYAATGAFLGLSLGLLLAYRLRLNRRAFFAALRAADQPTHIVFAGGRTEPLPDMTRWMRPSRAGDVASGVLCGAGGAFVLGEMGGLIGAWRARRMVEADEEAKKRIERGFRRFRAEVLRKEAEELEGGTGEMWL